MFLKFFIDDGTDDASPIRSISTNHVDVYKRFLHDLFGLGTVIGPAILGTEFLIFLDSLVRV